MKKIALVFSGLFIIGLVLSGCNLNPKEPEPKISEECFTFEAPVFEKGKVLELHPFVPTSDPDGCEGIYLVIDSESNIKGDIIINDYFAEEFEAKYDAVGHKAGKHKGSLGLVESHLFEYAQTKGQLTFSMNNVHYLEQFIKNDNGECCRVLSPVFYRKYTDTLFTDFETIDRKYELTFRDDGTGHLSGAEYNQVEFEFTNNKGHISIYFENGTVWVFKYYNNGMLIMEENNNLYPCKYIEEVTVAVSPEIHQDSIAGAKTRLDLWDAISDFPHEMKKTLYLCGDTSQNYLDASGLNNVLKEYPDVRNIYIELDPCYKNFNSCRISNSGEKDINGVVSFKYCDGNGEKKTYEIAEKAFFNYKELKEVNISAGCESIAFNSFMGCDKLEKVTIEKPEDWIIVDADSLKSTWTDGEPAPLSTDAAANAKALTSMEENKLFVRKRASNE